MKFCAAFIIFFLALSGCLAANEVNDFEVANHKSSKPTSATAMSPSRNPRPPSQLCTGKPSMEATKKSSSMKSINEVVTELVSSVASIFDIAATGPQRSSKPSVSPNLRSRVPTAAKSKNSQPPASGPPLSQSGYPTAGVPKSKRPTSTV